MTTRQSSVAKELHSNKILIFVSLAISLVINIGAFTSLLVGKMFSAHSYILITLILIDAFLVVASAKSNFRFSYSKTLPLICGGVKIVLLVVLLLISDGIFSTLTLAVFFGAQLFTLVSLLFSLIDASNRGAKMKFATIIVTLLFAVAGGFYTATTFSKGFFGQGNLTHRAITYTLNDDGASYTASGLVDGFGQTITIPENFNGKPVTAIDCLALSGVTELYLQTEKDVAFNNIQYAKLNENLIVYTSKNRVDLLKNQFVSLVKGGSAQQNNAMLLSNAITPIGLNANEVFITFSYTVDNLKLANKQLIPTWYGTAQDVFNLQKHAPDLNYARDYDLTDENYLKTSYINNGYALGVFSNEGQEVNNAAIDQSISKLAVNFEQVFKILVGADNDTIYQDETFPEIERYVIKADTTNLLSQVKQRDGFTLTWNYSIGNSIVQQPFTSLSSVVAEGITIYPTWKLNAPLISLTTERENNSFIYGDDVTISSSTKAPLSDCSLAYSWTKNTSSLSTEQNYQMTNVIPSDTGEYTLSVTASSPQTSLTSTNSLSIAVSVDKKELGFTWTLPTDTVYSGEDKTIGCNFVSSDVINGDQITFLNSTPTVKDAGSYTPFVSLTGECNELYKIKAGNETTSLSITPYVLTAIWVDTSLTYNGLEQAPNISALTGVGLDGTIAHTINGYQRNAGNDYVATAIISDDNYTLENNVKTFSIAKKPISVNWSNTTKTYNGYAQLPSASVSGAVNSEIVSVILSGERKDAGSSEVTATVTNPNYAITSNPSTTFTIAPKDVTITYSSSPIYYNGQQQMPSATVSGIINGNEATISYSGQGVNANSYNLTASVTYPGTTSVNGNYTITSGATTTYSIQKRKIDVNWPDTEIVYNGTAQTITARPMQVIDGDVVGISYTHYSTSDLTNPLTSAPINVGSYKITAESLNANYEINSETASATYTISPKEISLSFSLNTTIIETGEKITFEAISIIGAIPGESVTIDYYYEGAGTTDGAPPVIAGAYTVRASLASTSANANYTLVGNTVANFNIIVPVGE